MAKNKDSTSNGGDGSDYEVGYKRPPRHTQFQPGQSGNPAGRPRGLNNLSTDVKRMLEASVTITERGRKRRISTQRGALMLLREMVMHGDRHAQKQLFELAKLFNNEPSETVTQALPAEDQAILAAYEEEITAAAVQSPPAEPFIRVRLSDRFKSSSSDDETSK
jgi:hypothetical protein